MQETCCNVTAFKKKNLQLNLQYIISLPHLQPTDKDFATLLCNGGEKSPENLFKGNLIIKSVRAVVGAVFFRICDNIMALI